MSNVSLLQQVAHVGRCARRLLWIRALLLIAAAALLLALLVILSDYAMPVNHRGLRWLVSLSTLGCWLTIACRLLRPLVGLQLNEVGAARWIERSHPMLQDRLSSAVQFLRDAPRDATAGSAELRAALVQQATAQAERLELDGVLDRRCIWRVVPWGVAAMLAWGALAAWSSIDLRTGLRRLAVPWNAPRWPTLHRLSFQSLPLQVAQGDSLRVRVVDGQRPLPPRVQLWYWPQDRGFGDILCYDMRRTGDAAEWTIHNIRQPFRLRATGGDHRDMGWLSVNVAEAPAIVDLQISVEPPSYTGWPIESVDADFSALQGSRVWLQGRSTRPLREAWLSWRDDAGQTGRIPLSLSDNGRIVALDRSGSQTWLAAANAQYHLRLLDRGGIQTDVHRGNLSVQIDHAPTLELRQPAAEILVGPNSLVPLDVQVSDDLAVQQVQLIYTRSDEEALPAHSLVLFERTDPPRARAETRQGAETQTLNYDWDLSLIPDLPLNAVVSWHLSAKDNGGQQTQTATRHWTLRSAEEQLQHFARQEQELLTQFSEIALAQQRVQKSVQQTLPLLQQAHADARALASQIEAVSLTQRGVREALTDSPASLLRELQAQWDAIRRSRIAVAVRLQRREAWISRLEQLDRGALAQLEDALNNVIDDLADVASSADLSGPADLLQRAVPLQQDIVDQLQMLVAELRQQDALQTRIQELRQLRQQQQTLLSETTALAEVTISRSIDSMPASQRDQLRTLVERQLELARQAEQTVAGLGGASSGTFAAETARLASAHQAAVELGLSARMRLAAQDLQLNRVGNASQQQQAVDAVLSQLLDILQSDTPSSVTQQQGSVQTGATARNRQPNGDRLRDQLQQLLDRQEELLRAVTGIEDPTPADPEAQDATDLQPLADLQLRLADDTQTVSVETAGLCVSSWTLQQAAGEMRQASGLLQQHAALATVRKRQESARDQLIQVQDTWQAAAATATQDSSSQADRQTASPAEDGRRRAAVPLAEVRLLTMLQSQLNQQTRQCQERLVAAGGSDRDVTLQLEMLAARQGELAGLLHRLLAAAADAPTQGE